MNNKTSLPARAFIETEADAARFWQIGILWRLMASGIKTANTLSFLDEIVGGEAGGPVTHAHPTDEGFYVIDGRCRFYAGGKTIDARPGAARWTRHTSTCSSIWSSVG